MANSPIISFAKAPAIGLALAVSLPFSPALSADDDHGAHEAPHGSESKNQHSDGDHAAAKSGHDGEAEDSHEGEGAHDDEKEGGGISIPPYSRDLASIVVSPLKRAALPSLLNAPGEVRVNEYNASVVTPRIPAIIQKRHALLGETVSKGTVLATLFSVEMADAQGEHLIASQEWRRVQKLGKSIVSDKRYTETYLAFQQSTAKLETYGMAPDDIRELTQTGKAKNLGSFNLIAEQDGVIVNDAFRLGELIEPGRAVFEIVDQTTVWVDAKISIGQSRGITPGTPALVRFDGQTRNAAVKQVLSQIDETTRTVSLRLELPNHDRQFKPGQFVDVDLVLDPKPVLSVPTEAVIKSPDGDLAVFVEDAEGKFALREIETVRQTQSRTVIEGLPEGTRIVTRGAFFVQSEAAKGSFQVDNH